MPSKVPPETRAFGGRMARRRGLLLALVLLMAVLSCQTPEQDPRHYIEKGDLPALMKRGYLRIIMPPLDDSRLPRRGYAIGEERRLASRLASVLGLEAILIAVPDRREMLSAILEGRGDLVLARLTITPERKEILGFSLPLDYASEVLVVPQSNMDITAPEDLEGVEVAVRASSSFRGTLARLGQSVPGLKIRAVTESMDTEQILARVAGGEYAATVADEDLLDAVKTYTPNLKKAFSLTKPRPIAWGMRLNSPLLKEKVDAFLQMQAMTGQEKKRGSYGLKEIRKRKILRVLTRNNAVSSYLHKGKQMGFEFELARRFARTLGCRIQIIIPPESADMITWLLQGRGDLIAASMTVTERRAEHVAFTSPYLTAGQLLVSRSDEPELSTVEDLAGRTVTVKPSSRYFDSLMELKAAGLSFDIDPAHEGLETEAIIRGVASRDFDLTVADKHILDIEKSWNSGIRAGPAIGAPANIAWGVRPGNVELLKAADRFIRKQAVGSKFFNVLRIRYFTDLGRISSRIRARPEVTGRISPYDDLFRKYGEEVNIDWRLLAAQAYQESRFNPKAQSWAGARGLMQIVPRTLPELGLDGDLMDPEFGIKAGSLYMRRLLDRYNPNLPAEEQILFALAAYNAGPGHVRDGRRVAREEGWEPNVWFGNVEKALPMLGRSPYVERARYGYCRCMDVAGYVREIQERYLTYVEATRLKKLASPKPLASGAFTPGGKAGNLAGRPPVSSIVTEPNMGPHQARMVEGLGKWPEG